jgi:hypothetical protein
MLYAGLSSERAAHMNILTSPRTRIGFEAVTPSRS